MFDLGISRDLMNGKGIGEGKDGISMDGTLALSCIDIELTQETSILLSFNIFLQL